MIKKPTEYQAVRNLSKDEYETEINTKYTKKRPRVGVMHTKTFAEFIKEYLEGEENGTHREV